MNRLVTTDLGGFPLFLNDARFLDEAIREVLSAGTLAWGDPAGFYIISGCEKTDIIGPGGIPQYQIAAGYVALGGEVFRVNAHVLTALLPGAGTEYHWVVTESYASDGDKIFKDGSAHQTHLQRRAKVVLAAPPAGDYLPMEGVRLETLITRRALDLGGTEENPWLNPTLGTGWAFPPPGRQPMQLRLRRDGRLELRGTARQLGSDTLITTLPAAPASARRLVCASQSGGTYGICHLEWQASTGNLVLLDGSATDFVSIEQLLTV